MKFRIWAVATISVVSIVEADSEEEAEAKAKDLAASDIPGREIAQDIDPDGKWHFHEGSQFAIVDSFEAEEVEL